MGGRIIHVVVAAGLAGAVGIVWVQQRQVERALQRQNAAIAALGEQLDARTEVRHQDRITLIREAALPTTVAAPAPAPAPIDREAEEPRDDGEAQRLEALAREGESIADDVLESGVLTTQQGLELRAILSELDRDGFIRIAGPITTAINHDEVEVEDLAGPPF